MHGWVVDYFGKVALLKPEIFSGAIKVVEYGSYDINGSVRGLFRGDGLEYVGVDWRPGRGVDRVSLFHDWNEYGRGSFDVGVSTSTLEHDPHWPFSLARLLFLIKPGGHIIMTWQTPACPSHEVKTSPEEGYYGGVSLENVLAVVSRPWVEVLHSEEVGENAGVFLRVDEMRPC